MIKSAIDLRNPRLRPAVGGFARDEVQAFLAVAADDYETAIQALEQLRAEHAQVTSSLLEARNHEREVARVLSAAERSAQEILGRAQQTAGERIGAAERKIGDLLRDADAERERILAEIAGIRDRQSRIVRVLETEITALRQPVLVEQARADRAASDEPSVPASAAGPAVQGGAVEDAAAPELPGIAVANDEQQVSAATAERLDSSVPVDAGLDDRSTSGTGTSLEPMPIAGVPVDRSRPADSDEQVAGAVAAPEPRPGAVDAPKPQLGETLAALAAPADSAPAEDRLPGNDGPLESAEPVDDVLPDADRSRTPRRRVLVAAGIAAVAIVSVAAIPWLRTSNAPAAPLDRPDGTRAHAAERTERPAADAGEVKTPSSRAQTQNAAGPVLPAPETTPAAAARNTIAVRLEATGTCWLRFTTGDRSEEFLLEAGDVIERTSTADVVLRTGNAGALIVSVNGRAIPPLGGEGEVVTRRITRPISLVR